MPVAARKITIKKDARVLCLGDDGNLYPTEHVLEEGDIIECNPPEFKKYGQREHMVLPFQHPALQEISSWIRAKELSLEPHDLEWVAEEWNKKRA